MSLIPRCAEPPWLKREGKELIAEGIPLRELAARWGTPLYVYSVLAITENLEGIKKAFSGFPIRLFYAVKANSNKAILRLLHRGGVGAEVVSQGELFRTLLAGFAPQEIIFTGTGKKEGEIRFALEQRIHAIVVECLEELEVLKRLGRETAVALRINLGLDVGAHPFLTTSAAGAKFGLDEEGVGRALDLLRKIPYLRLVGLHTHLGSGIADAAPYISAAESLQHIAGEVVKRGFPLEFLDLGGGFAVNFPFSAFAEALKKKSTVSLKFYFEPGRALVGRAGILLARVLYVKKVHGKKFVVVDAAMNDLIRPALYGAQHPALVDPERGGEAEEAILVGPVCENSDKFGVYFLPPVEPGDLVVFLNAGAYGFSMASSYNSRPRPAEILLGQGEAWLIRKRETIEDLIRGEEVPEWLS